MVVKRRRYRYAGILIFIILSTFLVGCSLDYSSENVKNNSKENISFSLEEIPEFNGSPYILINNNMPEFDKEDYTTEAFENYSELDKLGRCGSAFANVCKEIMPTEERGAIGMIKPSGWQTVKYDFVDGKYLYNRCHLIGYQLSGENDNEKNLITGTRFLNVEGMLPFENMVDNYVDSTGNHVLFRVTPIYEGNNLVASGIQMEAWSVEDEGKGICFNIFVYNSQPGIVINYSNGESKIDENYNDDINKLKEENSSNKSYVINTNTGKFHNAECDSVKKISDGNKLTYYGNRDEVVLQGFEPCGNCKP